MYSLMNYTPIASSHHGIRWAECASSRRMEALARELGVTIVPKRSGFSRESSPECSGGSHKKRASGTTADNSFVAGGDYHHSSIILIAAGVSDV